jgi:hypothetical protein
MTNKELARALKQLKTLKSAGAPSAEFLSRSRDILMMQIKNSSAEPVKMSGLARARWILSSAVPRDFYKSMVRPMAASFAMLFVAAGAWAASVSVSYETVPGDALYSLKMMAEKTQLTFSSQDVKPSLQVEFANRRLEEINKIANRSAIKNKEARTKEAVKNFNFYIAAVKTELDDLASGSSSEKAMEVAQMVNRKTEEYGTVLNQVRASAGTETQKEVDKATSAVDGAALQAVNVIVKNSAEASSTIINSIESKVIKLEGSLNGAGAQSTEAMESLNEAKAALENNDLNAAADKLIEVKLLMDGAIEAGETGDASTSTNIK